MRTLAPVVLFVYNRPEHTARTLAALRANRLASSTDLFVYADGPKSGATRTGVDSVRQLVRRVDGFKSVHLTERPQNLGLARSIISGVTELVQRSGRVVVLEDDLVTSPFFLDYMNDGLDLYADEERVASIHGYMYPVAGLLPESFFLRGADCWGWGTWARAWRLFEPDAAKLSAEIAARHLENAFDMEGAFRFTRMLEQQAAGKLDSWAIRWHASAFLNDKLTLYPGVSLVNNIGADGSGMHTPDTAKFEGALSQSYAGLKKQPIEECEQAKRLIREFNRRTRGHRLFGLLRMVKRRAVRLLQAPPGQS